MNYKFLLVTLLLTFSIVLTEKSVSDGNLFVGNEHGMNTSQTLYSLPKFENTTVCDITVSKEFNIFNAKVSLQNSCSGDSNLHCGDTRFPKCLKLTKRCVAEIPSGNDEDEIKDFSLPTDLEYNGSEEFWNDFLPGSDSVKCRPTPMSLPEAPTCDKKDTYIGVDFLLPNFMARVPGLWNSCGKNADPENTDTGLYCTTESMGFCNNDTNLCQKEEWVNEEALVFVAGSNPNNYGFAQWKE